METINERVKEVRKVLKMTLAEFSSAIGLQTGSLSDIERGRVKNVTEQNIKLICHVFNVNEKWLRDGMGSMFPKDSVDIMAEQGIDIELSRLTVQLNAENDPQKKAFITECYRLVLTPHLWNRARLVWEPFARILFPADRDMEDQGDTDGQHN